MSGKYFYLALMLIAMASWGVAWPLGKVATLYAAPEVAAFWRYFISFLALIPILVWVRPPLAITGRGLAFTLFAALLTAVFNWLFFAGLAHGAAGYGGTIVTTMSPILTFLLSILIFKPRVRRAQILAVFVGLLGGIVLLRIPFSVAQLLNAGVLYFIWATLSWSLLTLITQCAAQHVHILSFSFIVFGVTAFLNLLLALPLEPFDMGRPGAFWWSMAFIGIVAGTFATTLYFFASGRLGAGAGSTYMFVVPVGAIVSSYWIFAERPQVETLVGAALALSAVFIFHVSAEG